MSFKNTFQNIRQNIGRDSTHDWYTALTCFAVLLCVISVVNIVMFMNLSMNEASIQDAGEKKMISVNQADIQKAIENTREKDGGTRNVSGVLRTDPSL